MKYGKKNQLGNELAAYWYHNGQYGSAEVSAVASKLDGSGFEPPSAKTTAYKILIILRQ